MTYPIELTPMPLPVAMSVYECDECGLAVAWPAGMTPLATLQCRHFVPRSTTRKTWPRTLVQSLPVSS